MKKTAKPSPFETLLNQHFLLLDGAIGTQIYAEGVLLKRSFEEQNIANPSLVRRVHRSYIEAGADILTSNTFGANRIRLASYGLADKVVEINRAGLRILREELAQAYPNETGETGEPEQTEEAKPRHLVAASLGPCLMPSQVWQDAQRSILGDAFDEQLRALCDAKHVQAPDLILAETFTHLQELELLYECYGKLADEYAEGEYMLPPLVLGLTISEHGLTAAGLSWRDFVQHFGNCSDVAALLINCGLGPAQLFQFVEQNIRACPKPLMVRPNAGYPQESNGRTVYLTTPEYFTLYGKRFHQIGASAYGGCCGTRPEHIAECAKLLHSLNHQHVEIQTGQQSLESESLEPIALEQRSTWGAKLAAGEKVSSVELLPPRTPVFSGLLRNSEQCKQAGIDAINIPDGPRASARVSPLLSAIEVEQKVGIETILHYTCRDRNLLGIQADLLGGYACGLRNLLAVTGDPPKLGDYPDSSGVFDIDAIGLTQVLEKLKHGQDIGSSSLKKPLAYVVGVALNPVALNPELEVERYVKKVAAGADFAITQPVFSARVLLDCLERCEAALAENGLRPIPVVIGIWPLASYKNAEFLANEVPGVEIPQQTLARMQRYSADKEDGLKEGIAIAREIWEELRPSVAGVQVSAPFGRVQAALDVII